MRPVFILLTVLFTYGCTASIDDYAGTQPPLDMRRFFEGDLVAYGMLQDRGGKMTRRFTATLRGTWQGDTGELVEHFIFDDGMEQDRVWMLRHLGDGHISGTAGDVVGPAEGRIEGSVLQWQYSLEVPWNDGTIVVNLDDWLFLVDESHIVNRTAMRKFGVRVGELTLVIEKR